METQIQTQTRPGPQKNVFQLIQSLLLVLVELREIQGLVPEFTNGKTSSKNCVLALYHSL